MKFILLTLVLYSLNGFAQVSPVSWKYEIKKIAGNTFELHINSAIQNPWHIYSMHTPAGGPVATKILFAKNPLLLFQDKVKEQGKLVKKYEEVFGIDVNYFENSVEYVQLIKLKAKVKTNITGTIEFMACNDHECLPPKKVNFNVAVGE